LQENVREALALKALKPPGLASLLPFVVARLCLPLSRFKIHCFSGGIMTDNRDSKRIVDYEKTIAYFTALHDVRFKILAFMPVLAGAALAVFAGAALAPSREFAGAVVGGLITLGLMSYDQRNTQIYDRLVRRAKFLERQLGFHALPGDEHGGAFHCLEWTPGVRHKVKGVIAIRWKSVDGEVTVEPLWKHLSGG
jgi:hypothetical protein